MPIIIIEGPRIDIVKRRKLAQDFAQAASEAYGLPKKAVAVILHEVSSECVAAGGELLCDRGEEPFCAGEG